MQNPAHFPTVMEPEMNPVSDSACWPVDPTESVQHDSCMNEPAVGTMAATSPADWLLVLWKRLRLFFEPQFCAPLPAQAEVHWAASTSAEPSTSPQ
jgi:hypothetical protein